MRIGEFFEVFIFLPQMDADGRRWIADERRDKGEVVLFHRTDVGGDHFKVFL